MKKWGMTTMKAWHTSYVKRLKRVWAKEEASAARVANADGGVPSAASILMEAQSEHGKMERAARLCGRGGYQSFAKAVKARCVCVCVVAVACARVCVCGGGGARVCLCVCVVVWLCVRRGVRGRVRAFASPPSTVKSTPTRHARAQIQVTANTDPVSCWDCAGL